MTATWSGGSFWISDPLVDEQSGGLVAGFRLAPAVLRLVVVTARKTLTKSAKEK